MSKPVGKEKKFEVLVETRAASAEAAHGAASAEAQMAERRQMIIRIWNLLKGMRAVSLFRKSQQGKGLPVQDQDLRFKKFAYCLERYLFTSSGSFETYCQYKNLSALRLRVNCLLKEPSKWLPPAHPGGQPNRSSTRSVPVNAPKAPSAARAAQKGNETSGKRGQAIAQQNNGTVIHDLNVDDDGDAPAASTNKRELEELKKISASLVRIVDALQQYGSEENRDVEVVAAAMPAVAHIEVFGFASPPSTEYSLLCTGSGFLWDNKGHVVTNYHVVCMEAAHGKKNKVMVRFESDTQAREAAVIGTCVQGMDIAVLKLASAPLSEPIAIGSSNNLKRAQKVHVLGGPKGLSFSLTTGRISAIGRECRLPAPRGVVKNCVQIDAPGSNPGNSGGPVIDSHGRLIGVLTASLTKAKGIHMALPVDSVRRVVSHIIRREQAAGTAALARAPQGLLRLNGPHSTHTNPVQFAVPAVFLLKQG